MLFRTFFIVHKSEIIHTRSEKHLQIPKTSYFRALLGDYPKKIDHFGPTSIFLNLGLTVKYLPKSRPNSHDQTLITVFWFLKASKSYQFIPNHDLQIPKTIPNTSKYHLRSNFIPDFPFQNQITSIFAFTSPR